MISYITFYLNGMSQRSDFPRTLMAIAMVLLVLALVFFFLQNQNKNSKNTNQEQNTTNNTSDNQDGVKEKQSFLSQKGAKLILETPSDTNNVICPINIKGWFFEATFPIQLIDENNEIVENTQATADGEWTADGFVEFSAKVYCQVSDLSGYKLKFMADNAAGVLELDDSIIIELYFNNIY